MIQLFKYRTEKYRRNYKTSGCLKDKNSLAKRLGLTHFSADRRASHHSLIRNLVIKIFTWRKGYSNWTGKSKLDKPLSCIRLPFTPAPWLPRCALLSHPFAPTMLWGCLSSTNSLPCSARNNNSPVLKQTEVELKTGNAQIVLKPLVWNTSQSGAR